MEGGGVIGGIHVGNKSDIEFYTVEVGDTTFRILHRYV
jgi:carbonic anhydrase/acetyltransferase-like protein (isoleucine patch superfamily)